MRHSHRLYSEMRVARHAQWALGRVHLGVVQPDSQLAGDGPVQVLFHGELYNEAELRKPLQEQIIPQPGKGVASLIATLYQLYGPCFPSRLQGTFCTAVLDEKAKRLVLASDLLGSYPLYWYNGPHRFVFASELKAVLRDPAVKPALEPRAVADYLTFGFLFGTKTLATQVQLLPAASILTFCWEDGSCTVERYWRLDQAFQPWEGSQGGIHRDTPPGFQWCGTEGPLGRAWLWGISLRWSRFAGYPERYRLCPNACVDVYTRG